MKIFWAVAFSAMMLLLVGCSGSKMRIVFVDGSLEKPITLDVPVQADGSFSAQIRQGTKVEIFSGLVRPGDQGHYLVSFLREGRNYVLPNGRYEYNSYTNSCIVRPNVESVLGEYNWPEGKRRTSVLLKMKESSNKPAACAEINPGQGNGADSS